MIFYFTDFKKSTRPTQFFKTGRVSFGIPEIAGLGARAYHTSQVIEMLWSEPAGAHMNFDPRQISSTHYNELVFSELRRFVVVREGQGSCTAV